MATCRPTAGGALLPLTDGVMLDIKAFDVDRHRRLTGADNDLSLASARLLAAAGKLYELRFLLIPGETDRPEEIAALAALARELGPDTRLRLNAFQHHGVRGAAANWLAMPRDGVEAAAAALTAAGIAEVALAIGLVALKRDGEAIAQGRSSIGASQ